MIDAEGKTKTFLVNVFLMIAVRVWLREARFDCNFVRKLAIEVMPNLYLIQFQRENVLSVFKVQSFAISLM